MVVAAVDLTVRLLAYGALLLAIPLSFVLLFRAIDYFAIDGLVEQYEEAGAEQAGGLEATPTVRGDALVCPKCGAENDRGYTFCRECQARLGQ